MTCAILCRLLQAAQGVQQHKAISSLPGSGWMPALCKTVWIWTCPSGRVCEATSCIRSAPTSTTVRLTLRCWGSVRSLQKCLTAWQQVTYNTRRQLKCKNFRRAKNCNRTRHRHTSNVGRARNLSYVCDWSMNLAKSACCRRPARIKAFLQLLVIFPPLFEHLLTTPTRKVF